MSTERTTIRRGTPPATSAVVPTSDRRHFLGAAGVGAAMAAGALAGLGTAGTARAGDSDFLIIGGDNTATNTTLLNGGTTLLVEDGGSTDNATVSVHQTNDEAVALHAETTGSSGSVAINAYNATADGIAVSAANSGVGGRAIRADNLAGGTAAILATNAVEDRIAVDATNWAVGGTAVNAVSSEDGTGLYASSTNGRAVYAQSAGSQETVLATSLSNAAVVAQGGTYDLVASGSGKVLLDGINVSNPPGTVGTAGVLTRDNDDNLWASVATNTWRKLSGPTAAGAFHPITPVRLYDSRPSKGGGGPLLTGEDRTISVSHSGPTTTPIVPEGAQAISYTLTVTGTTGASGYLSVTESGTAGFTASTVNWSGPAVTIANSTVVKINADRYVKVYCGGPAGASTNFIIDILGYYR